MNKLTIKFNNGTESTYKTPFTRDKIEGTVISNCPYNLFLRHSDKNPKAKAMLDNNKYLDHNKDSVLAYFGATITSFEKIDGRSAESKSLDYFTVEETLRNF
jgi:hypothetical protein